MKAPRLLNSERCSSCQIEHQHADIDALSTSCSQSVRVTRTRAKHFAALATHSRTRGISIMSITTPLTDEAVRASRKTRAPRERGMAVVSAFVPEKAITRDHNCHTKAQTRKSGGPSEPCNSMRVVVVHSFQRKATVEWQHKAESNSRGDALSLEVQAWVERQPPGHFRRIRRLTEESLSEHGVLLSSHA